jgi:hypothetical protein
VEGGDRLCPEITKRRSAEGVADLPIFLAYERIKPLIDNDLAASLKAPIEYVLRAFGFRSESCPWLH